VQGHILSTTGDALIIAGSHIEALLENALIIVALDCIKQYYVRCETPLFPLPPPHTHTHTHSIFYQSEWTTSASWRMDDKWLSRWNRILTQLRFIHKLRHNGASGGWCACSLWPWPPYIQTTLSWQTLITLIIA